MRRVTGISGPHPLGPGCDDRARRPAALLAADLPSVGADGWGFTAGPVHPRGPLAWLVELAWAVGRQPAAHDRGRHLGPCRAGRAAGAPRLAPGRRTLVVVTMAAVACVCCCRRCCCRWACGRAPRRGSTLTTRPTRSSWRGPRPPRRLAVRPRLPVHRDGALLHDRRAPVAAHRPIGRLRHFPYFPGSAAAAAVWDGLPSRGATTGCSSRCAPCCWCRRRCSSPDRSAAVWPSARRSPATRLRCASPGSATRTRHACWRS